MSIAVGQAAPDFTLLNQEKKEVKLSDFAGKRNVVLVRASPDEIVRFREEGGLELEPVARFGHRIE